MRLKIKVKIPNQDVQYEIEANVDTEGEHHQGWSLANKLNLIADRIALDTLSIEYEVLDGRFKGVTSDNYEKLYLEKGSVRDNG